jgi:ATP-dependent exoDNAse (exonuclease V) beta subunit
MSNNFDSLVVLNECFSNIQYFDKDHKYTIDGIPAKISVSSAIKKYEKEFEKEKIAAHVARKNGKTINEVLTEWKFKADYSCHKGSEFHLFVENLLERRKITIDKDALNLFASSQSIILENNFTNQYYSEMAKMIGNFMNFYNWWKEDHIILKSEFVVGDKSGICGSLDNLSYNKKTKKLVIFDYKTNKEIKTKNPKGDTFFEPFTHLQNCELVKYSIQIWLYKLIIEKNSPFEIDNGYIVWVAGDNDYELIPVLDLKMEAELILKNL